jgi:hypothetical protein
MLTYEESYQEAIEKANNGFIVTLVLYPLSPKRVTDNIEFSMILSFREKNQTKLRLRIL